ncbi:hypothetical protein L210DRAFT_861205 [Boletus edulis BED1]|uniref:Uncharacterized protein n=1 Tax=Boletus edulis BED1 TaxID=1328754 RepID=A0AAD4BQE2_BOLED|nr:hypothetical protein L210DRAFT_861205 [Boletus edulis BED1]
MFLASPNVFVVTSAGHRTTTKPNCRPPSYPSRVSLVLLIRTNGAARLFGFSSGSQFRWPSVINHDQLPVTADDVMLEILSHLPTLGDCPSHISFQEHLIPVMPSTMLVRTPTLRALSQASRLLRSRCLAMAWRRIELCGADLQKPDVYDTISRATETAIRVLKACPYLLPLIQTVSFIPTSYQKAEIIPAFAACLATLPNLDTIQVIHVCSEDRIKTVIKNAFRGKRFPSVRRIFLPSSMHAIIKSCRNVEEVACVAGDGGKIIQSLAEGKC